RSATFFRTGSGACSGSGASLCVWHETPSAGNEQFAAIYTPGPLGPPTAQMLVVTCLDHRVDPAITLGLRLGEAPVIRNAGGRVTQAVIDDIAFLAFLIDQLSGAQGAE